jgi:hypothetical protein
MSRQAWRRSSSAFFQRSAIGEAEEASRASRGQSGGNAVEKGRILSDEHWLNDRGQSLGIAAALIHRNLPLDLLQALKSSVMLVKLPYAKAIGRTIHVSEKEFS